MTEVREVGPQFYRALSSAISCDTGVTSRAIEHARTALPGVRLWGRSRSRPDLVESFRAVVVEVHGQRAEVSLQLLDRHRPDDCGGDDGVAQQPGQGHLRRVGAQLPTQPFVGLELVAVPLDSRVLAAGFDGAGEQPGVERTVR